MFLRYSTQKNHLRKQYNDGQKNSKYFPHLYVLTFKTIANHRRNAADQKIGDSRSLIFNKGLAYRGLSSEFHGFVVHMKTTRQTIGTNIRRLRVAKGISQEKLALEANIDRSYVGRIERGTENVTVSVLEALAEILGVKVGRLFDEIDNSNQSLLSLKAGRKPKSHKP